MNIDFDNITPLYANNSLLMKSATKTEHNNFSTTEKTPTLSNPRLPFLEPSSSRASYNTSVSSFNDPSNPYDTAPRPAPIGGRYTAANSYRNLIGDPDKSLAQPPIQQHPAFRPYRSNNKSIDECRVGLVGNAAPVARMDSDSSGSGSESVRVQGLDMQGYAGYRGMPGSRY